MNVLYFPNRQADPPHEKRTELVTQTLIDTFQDIPIPALLEAINAGHRCLDSGGNVLLAVNAGIDAAKNWYATHIEAV